MSKLHRLVGEIKDLERQGFVEIVGDEMRILHDDRQWVAGRLLNTGPWGALLLMGRLPEAIVEIMEKKDGL